MVINLLQVASYLAFKTRREYVHVALATASLLSTVLKTKQETPKVKNNLWFVNSHIGLLAFNTYAKAELTNTGGTKKFVGKTGYNRRVVKVY